ncbi:DUF3592 domain-containing protein [Pedobacter miscanthi]|uniref:DUF3592 domain-containing protein n=1 Tax=Pedobacter miscanthi TaxID=2259170 RepID=A0A366LC69_9SPHI|nr:DUF3592 domain-containing protein [Pedobacter miscanthi]RBQ11370.1 hypothetical protein DRW42_02580 [Pedobacter miscanthi]
MLFDLHLTEFEMICAIILSLVLMMIGLLRFADRVKLTKSGLKTQATVTAINQMMKRNRISFSISLFFITLDGKRIDVTDGDSTPIPFHSVGDQINIIYNQNKPEEIVIVSKGMAIVEFLMIITGMVGLFYFLYLFLTQPN